MGLTRAQVFTERDGGRGDGRCLFLLAAGGSHLGRGYGALPYAGISPTGKKAFAELSSAAETETPHPS